MTVNTHPLSDQIYQVLLDEILSGKRPAGERISEESLSAELHVSRTPAREALMRLSADGLIDREARKGCRIRRIDRAQQRDVIACRAHLEALALELGFAAIPPADLRGITDALQQAFRQEDPQAALAADDLLHGMIAASCPNQTLKTIIENLLNQCKALRAYRSVSTDPATVYEERLAIIQAISQGDRATACRLLFEHICKGVPA